MEGVSPEYALLALAGFLIYKLLHTYFVCSLNHIPGPFVSRFTNLWRVFSVAGGHAEKQQRELHDKLGLAVRLGPNMISISDPSMISDIYSRKEILFKSEFYSVNDLIVDGRCVSNPFSTRDEHRNTAIMKPVLKLFSMGNLLTMESLIDQTIVYFIERLSQDFASSGKECDMASWLHYCAFDVISEITFSQRMGFLEQGLDVKGIMRHNDKALDYMSIVGMAPWLDLLLDKNPLKRIGPPSFGPAVQFCLQRISERRRGLDGHDKVLNHDFLDAFLESQAEQSLKEDTTIFYVMNNVAAGSDTVAAELRSILYHLCKNEGAMKQLQNELAQANLQNPISWSECQRLAYLCACVEEGLRIMPGISLPLERVVGKDGIMLRDGRTFLPAGTVVGINPWVVNRDRNIFYPNPDSFQPERWLRNKGEGEEAYQQRLTQMRNSTLTFGAGKRQCPGRNLALLECHKIVASLVQAFDIELVDKNAEWKTTNRWFMRASNMNMRLSRRKR